MIKKKKSGKIRYQISLGILILAGSYLLFGPELLISDSAKAQTFLGQGALDIGNHMVWSASPVLLYVKNNIVTKKKDNLLVLLLNDKFPISRYLEEELQIKAKEENEEFMSDVNHEVVNVDYERLLAEQQKAGDAAEGEIEEHDELGEISLIPGEIYREDNEAGSEADTKEVMAQNDKMLSLLKENKEYDFLMKNFYIVDSSTAAPKSLFNVSDLLKKNMSIKQNNNKPQILIYHTHSHENFSDSRKDKKEDTVVGVGSRLAEILTQDYGYNVIHDTRSFDVVNGVLDRSKAYNYALEAEKKILKENPTIEVIIDLHRDGVANKEKRITTINGKTTAQIMFFNGLSRNKKGPITYLSNPNMKDNLAFSLQLHLKSLEKYPNYTKRIYLKNYRYNLHLKPKSLLIELGNQNNTVQEANNAMEPLANILDSVLQGEK